LPPACHRLAVLHVHHPQARAITLDVTPTAGQSPETLGTSWARRLIGNFDSLLNAKAIDLRTRELRFDIDLLADRLVGATWWLAGEETTRALPVGLFGASTGAAAALVAAAGRADHVAAVVSRGGRPDLAGASLPNVRTPTLLIVGGSDGVVVDLNRRAMAVMTAPVRLEIVPRATHLFEEPGALDQVARLARDWFVRYLPAPGAESPR